MAVRDPQGGGEGCAQAAEVARAQAPGRETLKDRAGYGQSRNCAPLKPSAMPAMRVRVPASIFLNW